MAAPELLPLPLVEMHAVANAVLRAVLCDGRLAQWRALVAASVQAADPGDADIAPSGRRYSRLHPYCGATQVSRNV